MYVTELALAKKPNKLKFLCLIDQSGKKQDFGFFTFGHTEICVRPSFPIPLHACI
jgi:hypothetical protein